MHAMRLVLFLGMLVVGVPVLADEYEENFHCDCHFLHPFKCDPKLTRDCPYGTAQDSCGCCEVCKKGPDERCGNFYKRVYPCVPGYECVGESNLIEEHTRKYFCRKAIPNVYPLLPDLDEAYSRKARPSFLTLLGSGAEVPLHRPVVKQRLQPVVYDESEPRHYSYEDWEFLDKPKRNKLIPLYPDPSYEETEDYYYNY